MLSLRPDMASLSVGRNKLSPPRLRRTRRIWLNGGVGNRTYEVVPEIEAFDP